MRHSDSETAVDAIAADKVLVTLARGALVGLHHDAIRPPVGIDDLKALIEPLFQVFHQPERDERGWVAFWAMYADVLVNLPRASIVAALKAWVAADVTGRLPLPAQLAELARTTINPKALALTRVRQAIALAEERERAGSASRWDGVNRTVETPFVPEPKDVRQRVFDRHAAKRAARIGAVDEAREAATLARFAKSQGVPDARGLTPQMRAHLAQQMSFAGVDDD